MEIGKIPIDKLKEIVLNKIGFRRDDVLVHAGIGEDSAVVDLANDLLVVSSDPITGAEQNAGKLAVYVACNDLAAMGASPVGIQIVLLLPAQVTEAFIVALMQEIDQTACSINVEILGGHTEILSHVTKPIIVVTAIGRVSREQLVCSANACAGDDLVLTKGLGIEGTYILASDYRELLLDKGVEPGVIATAREYDRKLSVIEEGLLAAKLGANAMHDVTEGGLYGALTELAIASGKGFELFNDDLPISRETEVICAALGVDPAGLISSGSMLIAIPESRDLIKRLGEAGIPAARIGRVIEQGRFVLTNGQKKGFKWGEKDELWSLMV